MMFFNSSLLLLLEMQRRRQLLLLEQIVNKAKEAYNEYDICYTIKDSHKKYFTTVVGTSFEDAKRKFLLKNEIVDKVVQIQKNISNV